MPFITEAYIYNSLTHCCGRLPEIFASWEREILLFYHGKEYLQSNSSISCSIYNLKQNSQALFYLLLTANIIGSKPYTER